jgi:hypothetical protein
VKTSRWTIGALGLLFSFTAPAAEAVIQVEVHPDLAIDDAWVLESSRVLRERALEASTFLWEKTDCGLVPALDQVRIKITYVQDTDGTIVPASYTFPDSTIRLSPEYATTVDPDLALHVVNDLLRLPESPRTVLLRCSPWERACIPDVVEDFILSEMIHELYHDWQNRETRFPTVELGKTSLARARAEGSLRGDWRSYLRDRVGLDMAVHDREIAQAEYEASAAQLAFWLQRYGEEPGHPLARDILLLMRAAVAHYDARN